MTFSTRMLSTARRLIRKYGQNISFSRVTEGSFVPSTGALGTGTTTSYTAYGCPIAGPNTEIPGNLLEQDDSDVWVEVNNSSTVPLIGDTCSLGGRVYRVMNVTGYVAQGLTVVFKLTVRI